MVQKRKVVERVMNKKGVRKHTIPAAPSIVGLRWDQIDLAQGLVHVARLKNGIASVHPLRGPELRALRRLQREKASAAYVFVSERKAPLTPDAVRKIVARAGRHADIEFSIHPHMLRHATGYKLANDGQDTRGHTAISRASQYPAHDALHRSGSGAVQELLA